MVNIALAIVYPSVYPSVYLSIRLSIRHSITHISAAIVSGSREESSKPDRPMALNARWSGKTRDSIRGLSKSSWAKPRDRPPISERDQSSRRSRETNRQMSIEQSRDNNGHSRQYPELLRVDPPVNLWASDHSPPLPIFQIEQLIVLKRQSMFACFCMVLFLTGFVFVYSFFVIPLAKAAGPESFARVRRVSSKDFASTTSFEAIACREGIRYNSTLQYLIRRYENSAYIATMSSILRGTCSLKTPTRFSACKICFVDEGRE